MATRFRRLDLVGVELRPRAGALSMSVDHATALPRDQSPEGDWLNGLMAEQQRLFPKIALLQLYLPGTCAPSIAAGISAGLLSPLALSLGPSFLGPIFLLFHFKVIARRGTRRNL